jgi:dihydrofolate reductase
VRILLAHRVVEKLRLMVFPVVIGDGKMVFPGERAKLTVELTDSYGTAAASCSRFTVWRLDVSRAPRSR